MSPLRSSSMVSDIYRYHKNEIDGPRIASVSTSEIVPNGFGLQYCHFPCPPRVYPDTQHNPSGRLATQYRNISVPNIYEMCVALTVPGPPSFHGYQRLPCSTNPGCHFSCWQYAPYPALWYPVYFVPMADSYATSYSVSPGYNGYYCRDSTRPTYGGATGYANGVYLPQKFVNAQEMPDFADDSVTLDSQEMSDFADEMNFVPPAEHAKYIRFWNAGFRPVRHTVASPRDETVPVCSAHPVLVQPCTKYSDVGAIIE